MSPVLYLKIFINRIELQDVQSGQIVRLSATTPFTSKRLLVGDLSEARSLVREAARSMKKGILSLLIKPVILVHPMEMVSDGLSEIEEEICMTLGLEAGARKVVIHMGSALSNAQVQKKIQG